MCPVFGSVHHCGMTIHPSEPPNRPAVQLPFAVLVELPGVQLECGISQPDASPGPPAPIWFESARHHILPATVPFLLRFRPVVPGQFLFPRTCGIVRSFLNGDCPTKSAGARPAQPSRHLWIHGFHATGLTGDARNSNGLADCLDGL